MCGRFALAIDLETLLEVFGIKLHVGAPEAITPRYNIAPGTQILAIVADEKGERSLREFRWGLVPHWAKDPSIGHKLINARVETAAEKPSFRGALKSRRCLIPASAFYEWKTINKHKAPYCIKPQKDELMTFAGLWECWQSPDGILYSCSILTTEATPMISTIHSRMPVILSSQDYPVWLRNAAPDGELMHALQQNATAVALEMFEVNQRVNNPSHDGPECWYL